MRRSVCAFETRTTHGARPATCARSSMQAGASARSAQLKSVKSRRFTAFQTRISAPRAPSRPTSVHQAQANAAINLDTLGLAAGSLYPLDFFWAERHVTQSNFHIDTSLEVVDCGEPVVK